ncbi:hypothetical protein HN011_006947 [Eciton burchellii]|nr:hypothetical protein HN011_006947 [Eciton burchellii]
MARNLPSDAIETTKGLTREHRFVSARGQSREDSGSDRCHRAVVSLFGVSGRGEQKRGLGLARLDNAIRSHALKKATTKQDPKWGPLNNKFAPAACAERVLSDRNTSAKPVNPLLRSCGICPDQSSRKIDGSDKDTVFHQPPRRVTKRNAVDEAGH